MQTKFLFTLILEHQPGYKLITSERDVLKEKENIIHDTALSHHQDLPEQGHQILYYRKWP